MVLQGDYLQEAFPETRFYDAVEELNHLKVNGGPEYNCESVGVGISVIVSVRVRVS